MSHDHPHGGHSATITWIHIDDPSMACMYQSYAEQCHIFRAAECKGPYPMPALPARSVPCVDQQCRCCCSGGLSCFVCWQYACEPCHELRQIFNGSAPFWQFATDGVSKCLMATFCVPICCGRTLFQGLAHWTVTLLGALGAALCCDVPSLLLESLRVCVYCRWRQIRCVPCQRRSMALYLPRGEGVYLARSRGEWEPMPLCGCSCCGCEAQPAMHAAAAARAPLAAERVLVRSPAAPTRERMEDKATPSKAQPVQPRNFRVRISESPERRSSIAESRERRSSLAEYRERETVEAAKSASPPGGAAAAEPLPPPYSQFPEGVSFAQPAAVKAATPREFCRHCGTPNVRDADQRSAFCRGCGQALPDDPLR